MRLTSADGTGIEARRAGRGDAIVLVHGSAGGLDSWDPVVPSLADEFEVWTYARRGYAPSDGCDRPKTFADEVADLAAVLDAAGGRAHVVGGSYGATVALHAALLRLPRIASIGLFEPPLYSGGPDLGPALERFRDHLSRGEVAAALLVMMREVARMPEVLLGPLAQAADGRGGAVQEVPPLAEGIGCLHDLEAMAADDRDLGRWSAISVPVLLMNGADTWEPMPATMDALAGALPRASRVTWPGQSHFVPHAAPDLFADAVRRFVRSAG